MVEIRRYDDRYKASVIDLVLDIQNCEAKIGLSLEEQPDLNDIPTYYQDLSGDFCVAINDGSVVGTIGLMRLNEDWAVLKKFFVRSDYRSRKVGLSLYNKLLSFAKERGFKHIILNTPSVATKSHSFYRRAGFKNIGKNVLKVPYQYPDRDSLLFQLDLDT